METLETTWKTTKALHHAYFLAGDSEKVIPDLLSFLEEFVGVKISGNPDFWHRQFDTFTIDDARALADSQEEKDFGSGRKIFIIQTNLITEQAQNALLKVFEEPTSGTHFFLLMPQDTLLPTLRSRFQILNMARVPLAKDSALSVLKMKMADRMNLAKEISDSIKDEKKTKQDAIQLVNQIESELYGNFNGELNSAEGLKMCQKTREVLSDNGAPVKMILENLMLNL